MGEVLAGVYNDKVLQQPPANRGFWIPADGTKIHDDVNYTLADDQKSTHQALSWIASHPDKLPELLALHFENTWQPYTYSHGLPIEEFQQRLSSKIVLLMIPIQTITTYVLALIGCIATWKTYRKKLLPVYIVILATIGQNVVFYGDMRFRSPIEPLLILLAGVGLWKICFCCVMIYKKGKGTACA